MRAVAAARGHVVIGQTLDGRYRLLNLLGRGGMGAVYEAEQIDTGRRVAVKVLAAAGAADSPSLVARFALEARAAGQLETPHVVRVLDAGVDAALGVPFMAMELLRGGDAQALIAERGALRSDVAVRIAAQACLGLAEAHEAGVVHRDIKSANLFLARGEGDSVTVKIVDFGLAKATFGAGIKPGDQGLTRTGTILGSPLFMAPEQARGARDADARSDIWSMGVVLFHLLTGRVPHDEIDGLGELLITICSEPPPRLRDVAPWIPAEIDAIVDRALRLDPRERFQSAEAMLEALFRLLPAGSAVTQEMLLASSASSATSAATPEAKIVVVTGAVNMTSDTVEDPRQLAARAPNLHVAPTSAPRPAAAAPMSFGDSDQAVASPIHARLAPKRRSVVAPLVLFAAAIVGGMVGVGMARMGRDARPAIASAITITSEARASTLTIAASQPPAAPIAAAADPAPAAVDAGLDASPAAHAGTK
jgi:serine/threonine-protein kinase